MDPKSYKLFLCLQGQKHIFIEHMLGLSVSLFFLPVLQMFRFPGYRSHFPPDIAAHIEIIDTLHCQTVCEQQ